MIEIVLWSLAAAIVGLSAGFLAGWLIGRRRLVRSQRMHSTTDRFLKLLNY